MIRTVLPLSVVLLGVVVACTSPAPADPPASAGNPPATVSDSPAGRALSRYLEAFNRADREALATLQADLSTPEPVEDALGLREFNGGWDLVAIESEAPDRIVARVVTREAKQGPERLTLTVHRDAPDRIATISTEALAIDRLDHDAAIAGLRARIDALAAKDDFAGAWLVARDGIVVAQGAAGPADRAGGVANTTDTRFRYGSLGKMFTAVAVLQQVEAGRLSLDGTVADYLPGYPDAEVGGVTLRQLLTHTGGTGDIDIFGPENAANRARLRTHADYLEAHAARGTAFAPGSKVEYSNFGFVLLGAILENVTGREYHDVIDRDVFAKAGMTRSGYEPEATVLPDRAKAYRRVDGAWVDAADTLPFRGTAAGGGYTTVGDLLAFAQAMADGRLLSAASLAQATSPRIDEGWYGFGFITVGEADMRRWGHGGGADGMNADFRVYPESGWVLASLSNLDPPAASRPLQWLEPRMPMAREAAER